MRWDEMRWDEKSDVNMALYTWESDITDSTVTAAILLRADIIRYAVCTIPVIAFHTRTDKLQRKHKMHLVLAE